MKKPGGLTSEMQHQAFADPFMDRRVALLGHALHKFAHGPDGLRQSSVARGRLFSRSAMASSSAWL